MATDGDLMLAFDTHCSVPTCRQLDFLPFKCDKCNVVTCSAHHAPQQHSCAKNDTANVS